MIPAWATEEEDREAYGDYHNDAEDDPASRGELDGRHSGSGESRGRQRG